MRNLKPNKPTELQALSMAKKTFSSKKKPNVNAKAIKSLKRRCLRPCLLEWLKELFLSAFFSSRVSIGAWSSSFVESSRKEIKCDGFMMGTVWTVGEWRKRTQDGRFSKEHIVSCVSVSPVLIMCRVKETSCFYCYGHLWCSDRESDEKRKFTFEAGHNTRKHSPCSQINRIVMGFCVYNDDNM